MLATYLFNISRITVRVLFYDIKVMTDFESPYIVKHCGYLVEQNGRFLITLSQSPSIAREQGSHSGVKKITRLNFRRLNLHK